MAVADCAQAAALDPAHEPSLAEAYCRRGKARQKAGRVDLAIDDYEKSLAIGVPTGSCECAPYSPLARVCLDAKKDYDRS